MSQFLFEKIPTDMPNEDFNVVIPPGLQTANQIFATYAHFPDYFGHNWNALDECVRDFSWITQFRIKIWHNDLPFQSNEKEQAIYLDILQYAIDDWKNCSYAAIQPGEEIMHELVVAFPPEWAHQIEDKLQH